MEGRGGKQLSSRCLGSRKQRERPERKGPRTRHTESRDHSCLTQSDTPGNQTHLTLSDTPGSETHPTLSDTPLLISYAAPKPFNDNEDGQWRLTISSFTEPASLALLGFDKLLKIMLKIYQTTEKKPQIISRGVLKKRQRRGGLCWDLGKGANHERVSWKQATIEFWILYPQPHPGGALGYFKEKSQE